MEERKHQEPHGGNGKCDCKPFEADPRMPGKNESIRRLLKALETELDKYAKNPTEATKKFDEELKEADKEYQGIAAIVSKYEEYYTKLKCKLPELGRWKQEITTLCEKNVDKGTRQKIHNLWEKFYRGKEEELCCNWIKQRRKLFDLEDCLGQARWTETESKDDYETWKAFEKTLTDHVADLAALFKRATDLQDEGKYQAICAVGLEYDKVYQDLDTVITWAYWKEKCGGGGYEKPVETEESQTGGNLGETHKPAPPQKEVLSPDKFKAELVKAFRRLILKRYQRFRWHQLLLETEGEGKRLKDLCEKFRKSRREEFIQEAEDVEAEAAGAGA